MPLPENIVTLNRWLVLALGDAAEFSSLPLTEAFGPCPPGCPGWADLVNDGFASPSRSLQVFSPVGKDADTHTHKPFFDPGLCQLITRESLFSPGATRDIGSALTRMCMRHRSIETKLRHFTK